MSVFGNFISVASDDQVRLLIQKLNEQNHDRSFDEFIRSLEKVVREREERV